MKSVSATLLAALATLAALSSLVQADLRPLVGDMLDHLSSIDRIERGLTLDDMDQVIQGAEDILQRSNALRQQTGKAMGVPEAQRPKFNVHLDGLIKHAGKLKRAAAGDNRGKTLKAFKDLLKDGCLPCHREFRDAEGSKLPSLIYLMVSLQNGLEELSRGVLLNDYPLVAVRAQNIQELARLLGWNHSIEHTFEIPPEKRKRFSALVQALYDQAVLVENAADKRDQDAIISGVDGMVRKSCLPCHQEYRSGPRKGAPEFPYDRYAPGRIGL
ncbi:MAG: hypothetical protein ACE5FC_05950 [Myxococcota bacterium]